MADAIPSWTQPKKVGNWDDVRIDQLLLKIDHVAEQSDLQVVLPVVARKMGLDDQYEEADGSPKQQHPTDEEVIAPVSFLARSHAFSSLIPCFL